jgi:hypothetical protein
MPDLFQLRQRLLDALLPGDLATSTGYVAIPETTTLMFYGKDGEAMFRALEPVLLEESRCTGGKVTIRQSDRHREVLLPGRVM